MENNENHEIIEFNSRIMKIKKNQRISRENHKTKTVILEFQTRIKTIIKTTEFQLRITKIKKILEFHAIIRKTKKIL